MSDKKEVLFNEEQSNQIFELQQQSKEIIEYLKSLQDSVSANFNTCEENFAAIIKRLNYENR